MADPVALQSRQPQPMTLADMVNMANAVQGYQQAQQLNPVQLETAKTNLSRLQQLTPLEVRGRTAETLASEGTLQPRITKAEEEATQSNLTTQSAQMDLLNKQANLIHSGTVAMINDPDVIAAEANPKNANIPKLVNKLTKFGMIQGKNAGIPMDKVGEVNAPTIEIASNDPGNLRSHLKTLLNSQLDAHGKVTTMQPSGTAVNTGAGGYVASQNIFGPQKQGEKLPGTEYTQQLPPGARYEPTGKTDIAGNPTAYVKGPDGTILGEVTIPAGVNAQKPNAANKSNAPAANMPTAPAVPANAPVRPRAGESASSYEAANNLRISARKAAAETPMQQFTANQIIDLADKAKTGVGSETLANLAGRLAVVPWTGNTASYFDSLGHYMTLQQASLAKSAGLSGTDQANQLAGQLSGTTNWTEDAIKSTARINRALATAASMFNNGIENKFAVTKDPLASNDFQSQWSKTADINAIRLHDAIANKDVAGIKEVVQAVDPSASKLKNPLDSAKVQFLLKKWDAMNKLVKGQ
jgi:hypothetical protein